MPFIREVLLIVDSILTAPNFERETMKTDPNSHCRKFKEIKRWAIIHDIIAHPLMAITGYSSWTVKFHNWTSRKAWIRIEEGI
jgi:hypothetical protein